MDALHLYLDSADLEVLRRVLPHPLVYGVTTNPTLLRRAGVAWKNLPYFVDAVFGLDVRALHLQVVGETAPEMVASGLELAELGDKTRLFLKLPATRAGLVAAARLAADGFGVTTTAVYRPEQALFSAQAGATYAAPYLGRLQDAGEDGLGVIRRMQRLLELYAPHTTRLLIASVRTREAALELLDQGVGSLTLPPKLFAELLTCPETDHAAATFLADAHYLQQPYDLL